MISNLIGLNFALMKITCVGRSNGSQEMPVVVIPSKIQQYPDNDKDTETYTSHNWRITAGCIEKMNSIVVTTSTSVVVGAKIESAKYYPKEDKICFPNLVVNVMYSFIVL